MRRVIGERRRQKGTRGGRRERERNRGEGMWQERKERTKNEGAEEKETEKEEGVEVVMVRRGREEKEWDRRGKKRGGGVGEISNEEEWSKK
jgi:hypothetical protein